MKCEKCGSDHIRIIMWDGARSGGQTLECTKCGHTEKHGCKQVQYKGHNVVLRW